MGLQLWANRFSIRLTNAARERASDYSEIRTKAIYITDNDESRSPSCTYSVQFGAAAIQGIDVQRSISVGSRAVDRPVDSTWHESAMGLLPNPLDYHWIEDQSLLFDCNGGIRNLDSWEREVVPAIVKTIRRADGNWFPTHIWRLDLLARPWITTTFPAKCVGIVSPESHPACSNKPAISSHSKCDLSY